MGSEVSCGWGGEVKEAGRAGDKNYTEEGDEGCPPGGNGEGFVEEEIASCACYCGSKEGDDHGVSDREVLK